MTLVKLLTKARETVSHSLEYVRQRLGSVKARFPSPGSHHGRHAASTIHAEAVIVRAAVLLRGGVGSQRVFEALSEEMPEEVVVTQVAQRIQAGSTPAQALAAADGREWRLLAAAWDLATRSGAPLAPALDRIAGSLRALEELRERRQTLLAGPRSTVRLVTLLPLISVLMGTLLGFEPVAVLLSPSGAVLLVVGLALLTLGVVWARAITRQVEQEDRVTGLEFELLAIALGGGAPPTLALRQVVDSADAAGAEWIRFDAFTRAGEVRRTIESAAGLGAPVGMLLLEEASASRVKAHADLQRSAEQLGIRVLVPLGACVLPAFVVLGVLPVLFAMLGELGSGE
ncbi:MAG: type II secretion system F family protein [Leucobacter sp.]